MAKGRDGKKRAFSQAVGEEGEALFKLWALKRGMTANKAEQDYGIDFYCQPVGAGTSLHDMNSRDVSSATLHAVVRSRKGRARPRFAMSRDDAKAFLDRNEAVCFFGVDLAAEAVYFRFKEKDFVDELVTFIESDRDTISWSLEQMCVNENDFARELARHIKFATRAGIVRYTAQSKIASRISGASLSVFDGTAVCRVPLIGSALEVHPKHQEDVQRLVFEDGVEPSLKLPGVRLNSALLPAIELSEDVLMVGGAVSATARMYITLDGARKELDFELRRVGDVRAYVHRCGLCLTVSDARKQTDSWTHEMSLRFVGKGAAPVLADRDAVAFMTLMCPGAELNEVGRTGIRLEWFPNAEHVGSTVKAIAQVADTIGLPAAAVYLKDLEDEGFLLCLGYLEALLITKVSPRSLLPGFVLDEPARGEEVRVPVVGRVPVVANFGSDSVVLWFDGTFDLIEYSGKICGFQPTEITDFEVECRRGSTLSRSGRPEIWFSDDWPPTPLGPHEDTLCVTWDGNRLELSAQFQYVDDESEPEQ